MEYNLHTATPSVSPWTDLALLSTPGNDNIHFTEWIFQLALHIFRTKKKNKIKKEKGIKYNLGFSTPPPPSGLPLLPDFALLPRPPLNYFFQRHRGHKRGQLCQSFGDQHRVAFAIFPTSKSSYAKKNVKTIIIYPERLPLSALQSKTCVPPV